MVLASRRALHSGRLLLSPVLALAWKFDLPAESEADLAEIRKNYMPELKDLEG